MSTGIAAHLPTYFTQAGFHRLTVDKYHRMIETGVLTKYDRIELLEGHMVLKMSQNPPHSNSSENADESIRRRLPAGWRVRTQKPITLADSEPEPDVAVVRGDRTTYASRHPGPSDIGVVLEVSDTTLAIDRNDKTRIYARASLPIYWIINLIDRQVEVYTDPRPVDPVPSYATRTDYRPGDSVPLFLDGQTIAQIPVDELLG
jgi:Uma2 family endonuclease